MKRTKMSVLMALFVSVASLSAQMHELIVLDADATTESGAYGINSYGYVVGYKKVAGAARPYLWTPSRGYLQLPTPGEVPSQSGIAYAINDYFDIVGTYGTFASDPHHMSGTTRGSYWVFDWNAGDYVTGTLYTYGSNARDINKDDKVACATTAISSGSVYDVYDPYNTYQEYELASPYSTCFGINDQGNIAGMHYSSYKGAFVPLFVRRAAGTTPTVISSEYVFPSQQTGAGLKVNTNNEVVGMMNGVGFYWVPEKSQFVTFNNSQCFGINDLGVIVGTSNNIACMWKKGANGSFIMTDLNSLVTSRSGIVLEQAFDINEKGQVVGQCMDTNTGIRSAFLLTPAKRAPRCLKQASDNQLEFNWLVEEGHTYAFRFSEDLKTWESYPDLYYADTGTNISVFFPRDEMQKAFIDIMDTTP